MHAAISTLKIWMLVCGTVPCDMDAILLQAGASANLCERAPATGPPVTLPGARLEGTRKALGHKRDLMCIGLLLVCSAMVIAFAVLQPAAREMWYTPATKLCVGKRIMLRALDVEIFSERHKEWRASR